MPSIPEDEWRTLLTYSEVIILKLIDTMGDFTFILEVSLSGNLENVDKFKVFWL